MSCYRHWIAASVLSGLAFIAAVGPARSDASNTLADLRVTSYGIGAFSSGAAPEPDKGNILHTVITDPAQQVIGTDVRLIQNPIGSAQHAYTNALRGGIYFGGTEDFTQSDGYLGVNGQNHINGATGALTSNVIGVRGQAFVADAGDLAIANSVGVGVGNPQKGTTGVTTANNYGLYVDTQTAGTDRNVGIWVQGATGGDAAGLVINGGGARISGGLVLLALPTTDPCVVGALWDSESVLRISGGC